MSEFDWRSPDAYQAIKSGDRPDFAWETLRRSPNYRIAYRDARSNGQVTSEFRRRWGICFRS